MKTGFRLLTNTSFFLTGLLMTFNSFSQKMELKAVDFSQNPVFQPTSITETLAEKCGHTTLEARMEKEMGFFGSKDFFENWINQKIEANRLAPQSLRIQAEVRKIPVVVHVIHTGTALGVGSNIPDSQIHDQIRILNEDYRRLNPDATETPAEFLPVAGDALIEFVLAKQDPNGLPTTGIVRVQGSQSTYSPDNATLIGQTSQWNPEEYLNIWVLPLVSPYIGFSSFPISDLDGLNFTPYPAISDGVAIDYRFFGSTGNVSTASQGRTATHEVGHYFGLRHIWGDGGCSVDDFVADTPLQDASSTTCSAKTSCGFNNMIQNFMDYTPDACMNIFTNGQIERFNVVLANSPRRVTLVNNRATQDPVLANRDLAIIDIIEPKSAICDLTVSPSIEIANAGNENITSARIDFSRNGTLVQSKAVSVNLSTGQTAIVNFNDITIPATGANEFSFSVVQVNGQADQNAANNTKASNPIIQGEIELPYTYNLSAFPGDWIVQNDDESFTWEKTSITIDGQSQEVLYIRNYEYDGAGELDYLSSPAIDLTKYPNAQLVFEVAHGPYNQSGFEDILYVAVAQDCGDVFDLSNAGYNKSGDLLATSDATVDEYVPTTASDFRTELVNLNQYRDLGKIRLSIINQNSYGNNIYIRNIRILPTEVYNYHVEIAELLSPYPISSGTHENEEILLKNTGNLPITSFVFSRTTNSNDPEVYIASGGTIAAGDEGTLTLPKSTSLGTNSLRYQLTLPNFDQNQGEAPVFTRYTVENTDEIESPWRENFEAFTSLAPWASIDPLSNATSWNVYSSASSSGTNTMIRLNPSVSGKVNWFGTPNFDLSKSSQASLFFDLAVGLVNAETELVVYASGDGGITYSPVWSAAGTSLSTGSSAQADPNSDFVRKYVNLSDFAGTGKTAVRVAFELTTAGTVNSQVLLDNMELFLNANPTPVIPNEGSSVLYPNPATEYFNLAFNLPSREDVSIQIISSTGAIIHEVEYSGTLNQTYTFSRRLFAPGLYIIRITSPTLTEMKRLIIN